MDGAGKSIDKQNKATKKSSGSKSGKWEANDLSQLQGLPGIRTVKGRNKKI